jgi:hypothetical protein
MTKSFDGQSLSEYGLVAGLIAVAALGGMILLGGNIQKQFGQMLPTSRQTSGAGVNGIAVVDATNLPANLQRASALLPAPKADEQQVCFKSGFCLNMPLMEENRPQTAGSLGDQQMNQMAGIMDQVASQLGAAGADPPLVELITKLANSGHGVGTYFDQMSADMKEAAATCGSTCTMDYYADPDKFNRYQWGGSAEGEKNDFQSAWLTVQTYMKENPEAFAAFPEAYSILELETQEIMKLANGVSPNYEEDPNAKQIRAQGSSSAVQQETSTYTSPSTGQKVTETKYVAGGTVLYQTIKTGKSNTSYQWDGSSMVATSDPPPTDGASTYTYKFASVYTLYTDQKNAAETVRQDANTICQTGGNLGSCYIISPATASSGGTSDKPGKSG